METIKELVNIIKEFCNYNKINEFNIKQLRNKKFGIDIINIILYRFYYCDINKTKQKIISSINYL